MLRNIDFDGEKGYTLASSLLLRHDTGFTSTHNRLIESTCIHQTQTHQLQLRMSVTRSGQPSKFADISIPG
jgi:hypothetical protein